MDFVLEAERVLHAEVGIGTMMSRLVTAALLGLVVGLDREYRQHSAGMRTHMLVSLAAATFALLTFELIARMRGDLIQADPVRVIGAVTNGVAFLAAGTIIQGRRGVKGLTTGAGMWMAGAIGLACGIGAYVIAVTGTVLVVIILSLLALVSPALPKQGADARDNEAKTSD
ncbi:MgtC/SapB family protein [Flaviflagellibacter deserti]|uniref:Protein MgtC n=1 Tax=Flaviflagellibacter deserti TaxID=2267266 RepID=A0ABV9Z2T4_9HYPH